MFITDNDKQTAAGIEARLCRRTDPTRVEATNVIPFPGARSSHQPQATTQPRSFGLRLRQVLRKGKDAVLSLTRTPNNVRIPRKRGANITSARHLPECHQRMMQARAGRREGHMRVSA